MPNLSLYYKPGCPFCRKVIDFMEANNISVAMRNTQEGSDTREELIKIGGKSQVPCLAVDGKALYESDDIIHWFEKHWSNDA